MLIDLWCHVLKETWELHICDCRFQRVSVLLWCRRVFASWPDHQSRTWKCQSRLSSIGCSHRPRCFLVWGRGGWFLSSGDNWRPTQCPWKARELKMIFLNIRANLLKVISYGHSARISTFPSWTSCTSREAIPLSCIQGWSSSQCSTDRTRWAWESAGASLAKESRTPPRLFWTDNPSWLESFWRRALCLCKCTWRLSCNTRLNWESRNNEISASPTQSLRIQSPIKF